MKLKLYKERIEQLKVFEKIDLLKFFQALTNEEDQKIFLKLVSSVSNNRTSKLAELNLLEKEALLLNYYIVEEEAE